MVPETVGAQVSPKLHAEVSINPNIDPKQQGSHTRMLTNKKGPQFIEAATWPG